MVKKVFHTNGYFAHPEILLLSVTVDHWQHVHEQGLRQVMKLKKNVFKKVKFVKILMLRPKYMTAIIIITS